MGRVPITLKYTVPTDSHSIQLHIVCALVFRDYAIVKHHNQRYLPTKSQFLPLLAEYQRDGRTGQSGSDPNRIKTMSSLVGIV